MKKLIALMMTMMLAVACTFAFTACGVSDGSDNEKGKFTVVTNCPFGNYEYIGEDGKIYGIDIELAGLFAKAA